MHEYMGLIKRERETDRQRQREREGKSKGIHDMCMIAWK